MTEPKIYWQDIASMSAGIWLMLTLAVGISTGSVLGAWLAYGGGAVIAALSAGGFKDNAPLLSGLTAVAGLIVVAAPWLAGITGDALATWSLVAGGAVTVVCSSWSTAAKRAVAENAPAPQLAPAE
ncbi:MAG: SPW repeat domain-containing protein [Persicimonas sp.]